MPNGNENQVPAQAPIPAPKQPAAKPAEQVGLRVSLIPAEETNRRDPHAGFRKFLIAVSIAVFVFGATAVYLGISVYLAKREVAKVKAQTAIYESQLASLAGSLKDAKLTQARLRSLSSLLGSHRDAVRLFVFLQNHTLPDVFFSSIATAENGAVNLAASAGSFESYAAQIGELRMQPEVKSLISSGLSPIYDSTTNALQQVNFALSVNFDPSIFAKQGSSAK